MTEQQFTGYTVHRLRFLVPMGPLGSWVDQEATGTTVLQRHANFDGITAATESGSLQIDDDRRMMGEGSEHVICPLMTRDSGL